MYYGARGVVGLVKPTYRPGSMESFIKLMPKGWALFPAHAGIRVSEGVKSGVNSWRYFLFTGELAVAREILRFPTVRVLRLRRFHQLQTSPLDLETIKR
jgi:hypothetical protein